MAFGKASHENSVPKVASLKRRQWSMKTQDLPDQQREQQTSSLSTLQGFSIVRRGRGSKRPGSLFRLFVLGLADVPLHLVLVDLVHYQLDGLRTIGEGEHQRLIKIHVLFFQLPVIHYQNEIVVTLFDVHLSQRKVEWSLPVKLLGLVNLKLVVIAFPAFLKYGQLVMGLGNGTVQLSAGRVQVILQFLAGLLASRVDLLLLVGEFRLHLTPARIVGSPGGLRQAGSGPQ